MLKSAEIVQLLSKSQIFCDFETAFNQATHLPLAFRPHELWQHALRGKKHENPFCALMAKSSRSCAACLQLQQELLEGEPGESASAVCFAGFYDTAIPVSVGNNVIGFLQTGQVALRKPIDASFSKMARQLIAWGMKVDLNELQDAYFHSKVLSKEQYQAMVRLLEIFAKHLSVMANQIVVGQENEESPLITAGIISSGTMDAPKQVFFIGMARAACILVGIASSILIASIFAPHRSEAQTLEKLRAVLKDAARRAVFSWQGEHEQRLQIGRKLIFNLIALNTLIEFTAAESGAFRLLANQARSLLAHIFSLISARRSLDAHLMRCGWPRRSGLEVFHDVVIGFLNEMPEQLDCGQVDELIAGIHDVRGQLALLEPERETSSSEDLVSERLVIDRLDDLLSHLGGAIEDWRDILQGHRQKEPRLILNFHRDLRAAWINGLRAFLAVIATGAFWIASAWDHGPLALVFVSVLMSLFSSQPHPNQIGWTFFKAGLVACFLGLICKYLILPISSEFEFLALMLAFVLFLLGLVMTNPSMAGAAGGFSFVFVNMVRPVNPMIYDLTETLNTGLASTLAYILIFPPDPRAAHCYVIYRIRLGLERIARMEPVPATSSHWVTRMYDRVIRMKDPQNLSGTPTDE